VWSSSEESGPALDDQIRKWQDETAAQITFISAPAVTDEVQGELCRVLTSAVSILYLPALEGGQDVRDTH